MSRTLPDTFAELQRLLEQYRTAKNSGIPGGLEPGRGEERVVRLLQKTGPLSTKEMAYLLGVEYGELAETVERMERSGFVRMDGDLDTTHRVRLTEKGAQAEFTDDTWREVFCVLSAKEQLQLEDYVDRVAQRTRELLGAVGAPHAPHPGVTAPRLPGSAPWAAGLSHGTDLRSASRIVRSPADGPSGVQTPAE